LQFDIFITYYIFCKVLKITQAQKGGAFDSAHLFLFASSLIHVIVYYQKINTI